MVMNYDGLKGRIDLTILMITININNIINPTDTIIMISATSQQNNFLIS